MRRLRDAALPDLRWAPYQEFGIPDPAAEMHEPPSCAFTVGATGYRGNDIIVYWAARAEPQPAPGPHYCTSTIGCEDCALHAAVLAEIEAAADTAASGDDPECEKHADAILAIVADAYAGTRSEQPAPELDAAMAVLAQVQAVCEQPDKVVGHSSGSRIINGGYLARHLLDIIKRAGLPS